MRTDTKYALALTASAALALSSCTAVRVETDDVPQPAGSPIRVAVLCDGEPGTKAMLDETSFRKKGNALQIWDAYYNDVQSPAAYLDGKYVVSDGSADVWPFRQSTETSSVQEHYYWTKTGVHRFYGVLVKDQSSGEAMTPETLFGTDCGFGKDASVPHKYVVPMKAMNLDSPQFDFLYSDVVKRDLDNAGGTGQVPLTFSHLFSAFAFTLTNDSPSEFNIKSMSLNVDNVASASVDYSSAWKNDETPAPAPVVAYADWSMSPSTGISGETVTMTAGECRDLFRDVKLDESALDSYTGHTLMWPQNLTGKTMTLDYETTVTREVTEDGDINKYSYNNRWNISYYTVVFTSNLDEVTDPKYKSLDYDYKYSGYSGYYSWAGRGKGHYAVKSVASGGGYYSISGTEKVSYTEIKDVVEDNTMTVNLGTVTPDGEWKAGKRYLYRLVNSNNEVGLTVTVMRWSGEHGGNAVFE